MGLLARLLGPRNPTAHWRARPELAEIMLFVDHRAEDAREAPHRPVRGSVAGAPTGIVSLVAAAIVLGAPLQGCGEAPDPEPTVEEAPDPGRRDEAPDPGPIVEEAPDPEPSAEETPDPEPIVNAAPGSEPRVVGRRAGAVDSIWLVPKVYSLVDPPPLFPVAWMESKPWICTEDRGWPYPPTGDRRGWTELHLSSSGGVRADLVARDARFIPDPECRTVWVHEERVSQLGEAMHRATESDPPT
jgi:hypothetical protein